VTTATQAYAFGNCTYYVATRFPNIYPYLGNAAQWITNAPKHGYTVLSTPHPDTVVVYGPGNGYSSLGHVAVVESVNSDGSFQVSEMNYSGYDLIDQRRSTMKGVIGFIVPPGSTYTPKTAQLYAAAASAANSKACATGSITIPNPFSSGTGNPIISAVTGLPENPTPATVICLDGLVGFVTMTGGILLMVAGVGVFLLFALKNTGLAARAGSLLPGPVGAVARTSAPKPKPVAPTPAEGKAASDARVAVAKARLSASTEHEVSEAKAGYGKRLSPEAREELKRSEE
jgi:surface antigen